MRAQGIVVFIFDVASLVGKQHDVRSLIRKLADGGNAGADASCRAQRPGRPIHRLVDVHAAEHGFPVEVKFIQCFDSKSHAVDHSYDFVIFVLFELLNLLTIRTITKLL